MKTIKWCLLEGGLERVLGASITLVMFISLFLQVISRYVFNMSLTWTEEVALFAVVWLAYVGASLAVLKRRHLRIELITTHFSPKTRKIVDIICNLIFLALVIFLVYGSFNMTTLARRTRQTAAATGWLRWKVIAGMHAAFILMTLRLIQDTILHVKEFRNLLIPLEKGIKIASNLQTETEPIYDKRQDGRLI
jgi:TRAP-type C4-dicarboxylate transport system permease small subunit